MTRLLRLEPLTAAAFAPFGDVVAPPALGGATALQATIGPRRDSTAPRLSFNHAAASALPLDVTRMERHPCSSQSFIPLDVARWVVIVAPDAVGAPEMAGLRAFVARGDQAVSYHAMVWHHPLRVLDRPGRFAVLMWTTGHKPDDEEWATLPEPVSVLA